MRTNAKNMITFKLDRAVIKRWSKGVSLSEFAIILALVAVVSLGALSTLGINVGDWYGNLAAALGGANPGASNGGQVDGSGESVANNTTGSILAGAIEGFNITQDPATGEWVYEMSSNNGTGTQTSSVEGTELVNALSQNMMNSLEALEESLGEPVDSELASLIEQFKTSIDSTSNSISAYQANKDAHLAVYQEFTALDQQGQGGGPPFYSPDITHETLSYTENYLNTMHNYHQLTNKINTEIGNNPAYANLINDIESAASATTTLAVDDTLSMVSSIIYKDRLNPVDLISMANDFPMSGAELTQLYMQTNSNEAFREGLRTIGAHNRMGDGINQ